MESAGEVRYMNANAVKSADLDLLATEEASIVEQHCGVIEGTLNSQVVDVLIKWDINSCAIGTLKVSPMNVSVGSDSVNANTDADLGATRTPDPPIVQLQGNVPEKRQLHDLYSKDGLQTDFMHSSVFTGAAKKFKCGSGIDGTERGELRKSCGSLYNGDGKDESDLVSREREESKSQLGTPGSKTTKKEDSGSMLHIANGEELEEDEMSGPNVTHVRRKRHSGTKFSHSKTKKRKMLGKDNSSAVQRMQQGRRRSKQNEGGETSINHASFVVKMSKSSIRGKRM
ncbi:hypothetical protein MKW94_011573, partial [Papaver nudicaule]|nr:hypothetical protein [Papaver nudicaule]